MKKHTVISGLLALFVAVGIFVSREFGDELKVMQHRSDVPEWGDEPFFADPDPQADAIVAATRYALLRRAAAIEAASKGVQ